MGIESSCPRRYFRPPEICGARQGRPQEGHDVAILYNTTTLLLESSKVCQLDSNQQRCLLSAVLFCRESGSRLVIGTTHLESGICDPANLRIAQLEYVLSRMDAYHLPCTIVAGDYNLRQWEAVRAKVRELKRTISCKRGWELCSGTFGYKTFSWGVHSWVCDVNCGKWSRG